MQERIVELLAKLPDGELTEQLLIVNDDLNNLFLRFVNFLVLYYNHLYLYKCTTLICTVGIVDMRRIERQNVALL